MKTEDEGPAKADAEAKGLYITEEAMRRMSLHEDFEGRVMDVMNEFLYRRAMTPLEVVGVLERVKSFILTTDLFTTGRLNKQVKGAMMSGVDFGEMLREFGELMGDEPPEEGEPANG
jgi:hypothetical protein